MEGCAVRIGEFPDRGGDADGEFRSDADSGLSGYSGQCRISQNDRFRRPGRRDRQKSGKNKQKYCDKRGKAVGAMMTVKKTRSGAVLPGSVTGSASRQWNSNIMAEYGSNNYGISFPVMVLCVMPVKKVT